MDFRLKATETTKWLRVKDYNNKSKPEEKLSVVDRHGDGDEVTFSVNPTTGSKPQKGYVQVEVARNVSEQGKEDRPSEHWGSHDDEMSPEIGQCYPINDDHLPDH